jgi:hypothetical protein
MLSSFPLLTIISFSFTTSAYVGYMIFSILHLLGAQWLHVFLSFQLVASIQLLFLHWFSICFLSVSFPCNLANPHLYSSSPFKVRGYVDNKTVLYRLPDAGATEGWWLSGWPPVDRVWEQLVREV